MNGLCAKICLVHRVLFLLQRGHNVSRHPSLPVEVPGNQARDLAFIAPLGASTMHHHHHHKMHTAGREGVERPANTC